MLDIKLLRENPDAIREGLKKRGISVALDELLELEKKRRQVLVQIENDRHLLKEGSEAFGKQKAKGEAAVPSDLKKLSEKIKEQEQALAEIEESMNKELSYIPNVPHLSVPVGSAKENQIIRVYGEKAKFNFAPKNHVDLASQTEMIDFARASKISGSHFPLYVGLGARLERALINWMLDVQTKENGYKEVFPPFLVNRSSMFGTGQLPKFEEDMYRLKDDDLFLIPTAEVPITNIHRDEVLEENSLPLKYTAYSACFRREAGSYGKDTRGMVRIHQFDKVELVKFTTAESSYEEHEKLLQNAEDILKRLGLHYRVVCLASQDLGFSAAKCYDLEAWAPGLGQYLEVSSCSNFEDFQARRTNIRYRNSKTKKLSFVHTINGSGLALARTLICLLETYQQSDGHITIPEPIRPYIDGKTCI
jgi:seryl-tRNA synthetase